jgi:hypothetical protein
MVKKKCKCKKRGRPRKKLGRPKGSKNKRKRRQKGGAIPALAVAGAKFLGPIALEYLLKRMKKGNGLRLLHQR